MKTKILCKLINTFCIYHNDEKRHVSREW